MSAVGKAFRFRRSAATAAAVAALAGGLTVAGGTGQAHADGWCASGASYSGTFTNVLAGYNLQLCVYGGSYMTGGALATGGTTDVRVHVVTGQNCGTKYWGINDPNAHVWPGTTRVYTNGSQYLNPGCSPMVKAWITEASLGTSRVVVLAP
ncbi:hypothetical protein ACIQBJ_03715 [Kitasatospora sp. NPDC088391]|uniref:hypothetical protein n=1 Tax=Kitasatospora sp. NPDC088391 TaxID=3364074 RepID=UPI00381E0E81